MKPNWTVDQRKDDYSRLECEDLGLAEDGTPIPCINPDCGFGVRTQWDPQ